ncbi:type II secretion system protein [Chitinimonas arctica]|uniref:Type II secretion system protein n=1 Tax=Chitinimonas arctica TaxID=2594795 RepID=A0A516SGF3_9NEIS|nr:GspE/PulE family protein [Chitinimonas arctica]QDQ27249.1 type II secretion system protein [Chitinimonas arctica]
MSELPTLRLGEILIARGALDANAVQRAVALQRDSGGDRLGAILIRLGLISEFTLLEALSSQLGYPIFDVLQHPDAVSGMRTFHNAQGINRALAQRFSFLILPRTDALPLVVCRDPLDSGLLEYLDGHALAGQHYGWALIAQRDFERLLSEVYRIAADVQQGDQDLRRMAEDAPVVELVNAMLARANDKAASDVHIEPLEYGFTVRYRVDGHLQGTEHYPRERFDAVVSRIKLVSGLDISERRLTQDGRFSNRAAGVETDIRVSVIPSVFGESLVMRLLPVSHNKRFSLDGLGFEPDHLRMFQDWMSLPDGIILVTGPTGSGKSTTLYAALSACDRERERILTVEDPVEYKIEGVTQFQVNAEIGFTFTAALRSILRHDPDTIMIGEIRDVDTARIAVQASLTGHRVLSTLHTNDSATAFLRLVDLGVEQFLVGATVRGVIAQRLVRRLCTSCSEPYDPSALLSEHAKATLAKLGTLPAQWCFRRPVGCPSCGGSGYRGRTAIYELLPATDRVRAVLSQPSPSHFDLLRSLDDKFRALHEDGLLKAVRGLTSLEEVFAVAGSTVSHRSA